MLASATVSDPATHAARLIGMPVTAVTDDGSPRGAMTFALWEPATVDGHRRSATTEAAEILAELVLDGVQVVAFARSRAGAESLATNARRRVEHDDPARAEGVAAYRGGYLPQDRREIERGLRDGSVRGLAATNALELGIDVSGLDAVVMAGWPGRRASLWQQAGRAGRSGEESLAVLVAADDPLDTYLVRHPEAIFGEPVEATVMDPYNPHVLAPHLAAAAAELPLGESDLPMFGPDARRLLDTLVTSGILRRRPSGWFWAREDRPAEHISLRGASDVVAVVEARTGRVLGTVDEASSHAQVHTGAVHVHQGDTWVVTELDLEARAAHVVRGDPGWSTYAQSVSRFDILGRERTRATGQGVGVVRHRAGDLAGDGLPAPATVRRGARHPPARPAGAVADDEGGLVDRARGRAGRRRGRGRRWCRGRCTPRSTRPSGCCRWSPPLTGGTSAGSRRPCTPTPASPRSWSSTATPAGPASPSGRSGRSRRWVRATRDAVLGCPCATGCPACVQSPKCGNGNEPLDKAGAVTVLELALAPASG